MNDYSKAMQARNDAFDDFEEALKAFVVAEQALKAAEYVYSEAKNRYESRRTIFFVRNDEATRVQARNEAEALNFERKCQEFKDDADLPLRSTD